MPASIQNRPGFQLPPSQRHDEEDDTGDEASASDESQSSETKAKRTSSETEGTEEA